MDDLYSRYPSLESIRNSIDSACSLLETTFRSGCKLLVCGNGGSAADGEHIVGELMKSFRIKRPIGDTYRNALLSYGEDGNRLADTLEAALPAISLNTHEALSSAYCNDRDPELVYAQLFSGWAKPGDTLLTLSTSGNSANCVLAAIAAKAMDCHVIAMTGEGGGKLKEYADVLIAVPEKETYKVQELHLPVYHELCARLESIFF